MKIVQRNNILGSSTFIFYRYLLGQVCTLMSKYCKPGFVTDL